MNAAKFNEERENLLKMVEEKEKLTQEMQEKLQELEREKENLSKRVTELTTESVKYNENRAKIEAELSDVAKKSAEYQKKCAGFFNQVMSLNAKQLEAEEEIASLKRSTESQRAQVSEKEAMIIMIRDQVTLFSIYWSKYSNLVFNRIFCHQTSKLFISGFQSCRIF